MREELGITITGTPLVQAGAAGYRLTRWWLSYLVAFGMVICAALLITPLVRPLADLDVGLLAGAPILLLHLAILGLLAAWLRWYERRPLRTLGFLGAGKALIARGFGFGVVAMLLASALLLALGALHLTPGTAGVINWAALPGSLVLAAIWLFCAGVQEALFRGFVVQATGLRLPAAAAIGGQAVLWAMVRAAGSQPVDAMAVLNLMLIGVVLALVALWQGSLWLALGIQAGWSWFAASVLGLTALGIDRPAALVSLVPTSASWLSGGAAGVVASPVITVIALAAAVVALRRLRTVPGVVSTAVARVP